MIKDLKEFEKFLKLCHKQGVTEATVAGVSVKISAKPPRQSSKKKDDDEEIPTDGLSLEELMTYHLRGEGANQ